MPIARMETIMLARLAVPAAFVCLLSHALHAEIHRSGDCIAFIDDQPWIESTVCGLRVQRRWMEPARSDPRSAHQLGAKAATLRQIAIYASIGNRDGVEILAARLHALGVGGASVNEALTWTKLHSDPLPADTRNCEARLSAKPGWAAGR
jgi:hypothetical protein